MATTTTTTTSTTTTTTTVLPPSPPNRLNFTLDAAGITAETDRIIARWKAIQDRVAALPASERNMDSVIHALAQGEAEFSTLCSSVVFPGYVHADRDVRDASTAAQERIRQFEIESGMREDLYEAVKHVASQIGDSDSVDPDERRLVERMVRDYERLGLSLPKEKRERVRELRSRMSALSIAFQRNLSEDDTTLLFTRAQLEGLPEEFINALPTVPAEEGKDAMGETMYRVSLRPPELMAIMTQCHVEETRRRMEFASSTRCVKQNVPLFEEAIALRRQLAGLLGSESHAHHVLEVRMARTPDEVGAFLQGLRDKLTPHGQEELARLQKLKKEFLTERGEWDDKTSSDKINAWDYNFYSTLLKEREYQVNEKEIAQYFPLPVVLEGMLQFVQETFRFRFEEVTGKAQELWHKDAQHFHVHDADSGDFVGEFYLDLYPRDGKYTHFAAFPLQCAYERRIEGDDGTQKQQQQHAVSAMVCNFTAPTADEPSLLRHNEVVTLLHEFGHLQHGFSSRSRFGRFSGTSVERDFVECPSQMMENWAYERDFLKRISKHYQTGEPLPDATIDRIVAAKNVGVALFNLRQLFFGLFDHACHTLPAISPDSSAEVDKSEFDSGALYARLREEISLVPSTPGTNGVGGFAHLMGGYDMGYYGYLWSEVYAADIFSVFKEGGLFSADIGRRYRQTILERGGMRDGADMLRDFLQREPSSDSFMVSLGLPVDSDSK